jgi:hypothetical protein
MGRLIRCRTVQTEVFAKSQEIRTCKGFCEDVSDVIAGANPHDGEFVVSNELLDGMELHSDMLNLGVPHVIFGKVAGSVIVTM